MGSQERSYAMKYTNEQIKDKYKHKKVQLFDFFNFELFGLSDDHLLIDFSDPTNILAGSDDNLNLIRVSDTYIKDYHMTCEIKVKYGDKVSNHITEIFKIILGLDLIDWEKCRETYVEFITLEDKIVKFPLIIFRMTYIKAVLNINMDFTKEDDFFVVSPRFFIVNTKSLEVDFFFESVSYKELEDAEEKGIKVITIPEASFISLRAKLNSPLEIKPYLRVVTGEK